MNYKREYVNGNSYEHKILEYLHLHGSISRKEVEQLLIVGQTMVGRILKDMVTKGSLKTEGKASKTKYLSK